MMCDAFPIDWVVVGLLYLVGLIFAIVPPWILFRHGVVTFGPSASPTPPPPPVAQIDKNSDQYKKALDILSDPSREMAYTVLNEGIYREDY